jgi:Cu(I)/Ag(I) efflux system protein CusF
MRPRRGHVALAVASLVLAAGCAGYRPDPLATSHPAHPEAAAAPERPPSQTLAYTRADIPSARPAAAVAAVPPGELRAPQTEGVVAQTVVGEGEVVATVPNAGQIVVAHGEIEGFMGAMTMGYRIDPPSLLAGLKPGDKVRFTIDVQERTITEIEKLR